MNVLRKIVFSIMDWMTDGALTENKRLVFDLKIARESFVEQLRYSADLEQKTSNLERANRELVTENNRLTTALQMSSGRSDVDTYVSDKTQISDLHFRIGCLEKLLKKHNIDPHAEQRKQTESWTGKKMGLM